MNSEELENSLRTEFESYLNNVFAEMRQEVSELQEKFQAEFEKHKSQLDTIFQDFSSRLENEKRMDEAFKESVVEHLRLAKDEGARITAAAIAEAEKLEKESAEAAAAPADYSEIRNAISEISSQDSQSAILKSLVNHAAQFTPRGAFFIVKNEHFVGWRVFGEEGNVDEQKVREIFFPLSDETVMSESIRSLSAVESSYGTYPGDAVYLEKLGFGQPEKMYAIPLIARGRGVAVLYADNAAENNQVNIDVLETLVKIAGMTVELLAASHGTKSNAAADSGASTVQANSPASYASEPVESASSEAQVYQSPVSEENTSPAGNYNSYAAANDYSATSTREESFAPPVDEQHNEATTGADFNYQSSNNEYSQPSYSQPESYEPQSGWQQPEPQPEPQSEWQQNFQQQEFQSQQFQTEQPVSTDSSFSWNQPTDFSGNFGESTENVENEPTAFDYSSPNDRPEQNFSSASASDFAFTPNQTAEAPPSNFSDSSAETNAQSFEPNGYDSWQKSSFEQPPVYDNSRFEPSSQAAESSFEKESFAPNGDFASEPVENIGAATASTPPVKSRLSERNVDLPIEVGEEERRLHNDARRFARLLVSEIKLYNEQKVKEGRDENDLYDRLREAIDRSREMYEKRVQTPVAAKFDYFHYELVNNLAEGEERKLGGNYPGSSV